MELTQTKILASRSENGVDAVRDIDGCWMNFDVGSILDQVKPLNIASGPMSRSYCTILIYSLLVLCASLNAADKTLPEQVESFLQPRLQSVSLDEAKPAAIDTIFSRPDPGTFFLRYAFGLKQYAKKLLTVDQARQLADVIERHSPSHSRWHDERNMLRCKFNERMWHYAAASKAEAPELRSELEAWMRRRMLWTQQEHLAQYRFARDVWSGLDTSQQTKLIAGEWKDYVKQETGHTRSNATGKIITRALGKPDDKIAFEAAVADWSKQRVPLHSVVVESENRERRIVFAMDLNCESLANEASLAANSAYSSLYLAEADATRFIVQTAYVDPKPRCARAAVEAWSEAEKRFEHGATELMQLLLTPK